MTIKERVRRREQTDIDSHVLVWVVLVVVVVEEKGVPPPPLPSACLTTKLRIYHQCV